MMRDTYNMEIKIKSSLSTDKQILIKKLLIDMCELANASWVNQKLTQTDLSLYIGL